MVQCTRPECQTTAGCKCTTAARPPIYQPQPLVSDKEVRAAKAKLDEMSALAGRDQPVPDTLMRIILEEAAMVRVGMKPPSEC